jgi:TP901 family phage tail tape measure protein
MAMNLDAVLRIAAKVVGLEDLGALQKGLVGAEKAAGEAKAAFAGVVNSASWQAAAAAAAGFGVAIGLSARAAMDFESSMADVRKVVDGLESPKAFAEMKAEILDLSRQMPITAKGFAEIYAAAGQSGIAKAELKDFAVTVAQVAVAFDMTAQEAGRSLAQLKVALGLTTPELRDLADAMNFISNNTGATAANLVEFMSRAAATGKIAGLTGQQTAAFGAAMIQTGINTEVAATSFNNMIKALSKGPSMTDRQVSALQRLGYAMVNAKDIEQQLTREAESASQRRLDIARRQGDEVVRVAEEQSRKRIELAREETEQLSREISRRYRNQLQALQDAWDDQSSASEQAIQDRTAAQVKALEREQDALVKAAQERARLTGSNADAEIQQIRDAYDARIDAIRDASDRELTLLRRADRDRQQVVRDRLQDEQDAEQKAAQGRLQAVESAETARLKAVKDGADQRFKAIEAAEKAGLEAAKASAAKTGEELAAASSQGFADRLQKEGVGVLTEVLGKIAALPKSQQVSVLSDLFGDEARGLTPLLANLGELERILGLARNKGEYTGSVLREFQVRSETAANKLQLFQNNLQALQITIGDTVLPALVRLAEVFGPILKGVADFAASNPALTTAAVAIGGLASALVIAAPGILATITLLGKLKLAIVGLNLGGLIAGWLPAVIGTLAKLGGLFVIFAQGITLALGTVISWLGSTFLPAVVTFFSGPVGWTVLAIAAVVAMAIAFREPLMQFFSWAGQAFGNWVKSLWQWGEPIRQFWLGLWNQLVQNTQTSLNVIGGIIRFAAQTWWAITYQLFIQPWINVWNLLKGPVMDLLQWMGGVLAEAFANLTQLAYTIWVKPWADLWNNVLREPVTGTLQWLSGIWKGLSDTFRRLVVQPIAQAWNAVVQALPDAMQAAANLVGRVWNGVINSIRGAVRGLLLFIANAVNSVVNVINNLVDGFNNVARATNAPQLPRLNRVTVPAFAEGGYVRRPTLGLVGEAGPEYIIPQSKMQAASERFLAGQRGANVLRPYKNIKRNTTTPGASLPQINITTGPVLEFNGERYVTVRDFEKGMRMTAEGVIGRLRTPAARIALGR